MFWPVERPSWRVEGADWPHRERSVFVRAAGLRWHAQRWPGPDRADAPRILLLHGVGSATHSWAGFAPLLGARAAVLALDLPGHGFTDAPTWPSRFSPTGMAAAIAALLAAERFAPTHIVGHSAGAALALRLTLDGRARPAGLVGLNAALRPFDGVAGLALPAMARGLFYNPLAPRAAAVAALDPRRVAEALRATGSTPPPEIGARYATLFRNPGHVGGALGMMAHWSLEGLAAEAAERLTAPLALIAGAADRATPPSEAIELAEALPTATATLLPGLGHLAHEEAPETVAAAAWAAIDAAPAAGEPTRSAAAPAT